MFPPNRRPHKSRVRPGEPDAQKIHPRRNQELFRLLLRDNVDSLPKMEGSGRQRPTETDHRLLQANPPKIPRHKKWPL